MNRLMITTGLRLSIAPVVAAVALSLGACAQQQPAPAPVPKPTKATVTPSPSPSPDTQHVRGLPASVLNPKRTSASAVAATFVKIIESPDTAIDKHPGQASRRADYLAAPALARALDTNQTAPTVTEKRWASLVSHHGWTSAKTQLGGLGTDAPPSGTTGAVAVTAYPVDHGTHGTHKWIARQDPVTWLITLERATPKSPWRVTKMKRASI